MSNSSVKLNLDGMGAVRAALEKGNKMRVQVGLFSNRANRSNVRGDSKITNPTLGAIHEFGSATKKIPSRSWLFWPIAAHLQDRIERVGRAVWRALIAKKGLKPAYATLGVEAELVVQEGFDTSGWGGWEANKPATIRRKGSSKPLIDSAQFRKAVSSRVVGGGP